MRRVELGIQFMQDVAQGYPIREPFEGFGITI